MQKIELNCIYTRKESIPFTVTDNCPTALRVDFLYQTVQKSNQKCFIYILKESRNVAAQISTKRMPNTSGRHLLHRIPPKSVKKRADYG